MLRAGLRDCSAGERVEGAGGGGGGGGDDGLLLSWAALELGEGRLAQAQQLLERARAAGGDGGSRARELQPRCVWTVRELCPACRSGGRTHQLQAVLLARQASAQTRARRRCARGSGPRPATRRCTRCLGRCSTLTTTSRGRAAFREALRLQPGDGRTFHAWARFEARLLNWEGLRLLNEQAQQAFPPSRGGAVGGVSFPDDVVV